MDVPSQKAAVFSPSASMAFSSPLPSRTDADEIRTYLADVRVYHILALLPVQYCTYTIIYDLTDQEASLFGTTCSQIRTPLRIQNVHFYKTNGAVALKSKLQMQLMTRYY